MIKMVDLGEDAYGPFTRVSIEVGTEARVIRWGLDHYTYMSLQNCLRQVQTRDGEDGMAPRPLLLQLSSDYEWNTSGNHFTSHLTALSDSGTAKAVFPCSSLYVANLVWLKSGPTIEEFDVRNDEAEPSPHSRNLVPVPDETLKRPAPLTPRRVSGYRVSIASFTSAAVIAGALFGLYKFAVPQRTLSAPLNVAATSFPAAPSKLKSVVLKPTIHQFVPQSDHSDAIPQLPMSTKIPVTTIWSVPHGDVALSIDDGPSSYTMKILSILKSYHIHATFFFVGQRIKLRPKSVVAAANAGNEIGDHSMTHPVLTNLSAAKQHYQIVQTSQIIAQLTGTPPALFRPPYGEHDATTDKIAAQAGMAIAMWNRDPRDWDATSAAVVVDNVLDVDPSGGIYDLHEDKQTVQALPTIIQAMKKKHLKFVVMPTTNN